MKSPSYTVKVLYHFYNSSHICPFYPFPIFWLSIYRIGSTLSPPKEINSLASFITSSGVKYLNTTLEILFYFCSIGSI